MSNHNGSFMLNEVLELLNNFEIFKILGKEKTLLFIEEICKIGFDNDCNDGEILEGIGEKLNICYSCKEYSECLEGGLCKDGGTGCR